MKLLLTGFNAFGGLPSNYTQKLIEEFSHNSIHFFPNELITCVLKTEYKAAGELICDLIDSNQPDIVIMLGLATDSNKIALENTAKRQCDSISPDNAGNTFDERFVPHKGEESYLATLPIVGLRQKLEADGLPVYISDDAGSYVCNHTFYKAMHHLKANRQEILCGFIHIPDPTDSTFIHEYELSHAIEICLDYLLENSRRGE